MFAELELYLDAFGWTYCVISVIFYMELTYNVRNRFFRYNCLSPSEILADKQFPPGSDTILHMSRIEFKFWPVQINLFS